MTDELRQARDLAKSLRYSGDADLRHANNGEGALTAIRSHFYQNNLRISSQVTPVLSERLGEVCGRLKIPDKVVDAFVYPSSEIQATCVSDGGGACIIRFSSTLIEIMDADEFEFVAGHELGHFLLRHASGDAGQDDLEHFMQSRAQEISADRIGLTACESLDVSIRAMMKSISGLTGRHLRFDVGTFIAQLKNQTAHNDTHTSHPSMLVRCRALLWFSSSDKANQKQTDDARAKLDKRIETDFQNYVDGPARKKIARAKENLSMWLSIRRIAADNKFSKNEQDNFSDLFGAQELESLKNYLQTIPKMQIQNAIDRKVDDARAVLVAMIPRSCDDEIADIERLVRERFL